MQNIAIDQSVINSSEISNIGGRVNGTDSIYSVNSTTNENEVGILTSVQPGAIIIDPIINESSFGTFLVVANSDENSFAPFDPVTRPTEELPGGSRALDFNQFEENAIYKDLALHFKPHPLTGDCAKVLNIESVKQSLKNLILTNRYERPFNPRLSGNVSEKLFEPFNSVTKADIEGSIALAIGNYEPRVTLIDVEVNEDLINEHKLVIEIKFKLQSFREVQTFELFLERI